MKKLMLILVLLVTVGLCFADWDTIPVPQPAKDLIDALLPIPASIVKEFGNTEKVRLIHHILVLKSEISNVIATQETRITALEKQVAELTKKPERQKVKIPELGIEGEFIPLDELPPEMQK